MRNQQDPEYRKTLENIYVIIRIISDNKHLSWIKVTM